MKLNNNENTNTILAGILISIIVLIITLGIQSNRIITLFTNLETTQNISTVTDIDKNALQPGEITVSIIGDERCIECNTEKVLADLKSTPFLKDARFEVSDFEDEGVSEMLKEKGIKVLPAVLFNTGTIEKDFDGFLQQIDSETFSLNVGAKFDPFTDRSDKGFLVVEKDVLDKIKATSFIKGETDSKITWLEYSDLECPFCAKLHNSKTENELIAKYGGDMNIIYNHFPLGFHDEAQDASEALECIAETEGADVFYTLIKESYKKYNNNNFSLDGFYNLAKEKYTNIDIENVKKCVTDDKYKEKVITQMGVGSDIFGVTGTPGNVIINNETGEYKVLAGAYPTTSFVEIIDSLLK